MKEKLIQLIGLCVLGRVMFEGQLGSQAYNVQDILHSTSLNTIDLMGQKIEAQIAKLSTGSFSKTTNTRKKNELQFKYDTLEAIYEYKVEQSKEASERAKKREEAIKKLTILTHAKDAQEIDRIQSLTPKKLAKEIAEAEKLAKL